jgi:hypothetical protein
MNKDQKTHYLSVILTKFVTILSLLAATSVEKTHFEDVSNNVELKSCSRSSEFS